MTVPLAGRPPFGADFPPFQPFPGLGNGHAQTIVARYLPTRMSVLPSVESIVDVSDGDRVVIHDSPAEDWKIGDPIAVLVHGLGGDAEAPYLTRVAVRLRSRGIRAVRMNLRGAGAGHGAARRLYHAGRSDDLRAVLVRLASEAPGSPIGIVGFSLGANIVLKLAGEAAEDSVPGLDAVVAANPPLDLAECCEYIGRPAARVYDRNFVRLLTSEVRKLERTFPDLPRSDLEGIETLFQFDDRIVAPRNGFRDALDYYSRSSSGKFVDRIKIDGLVIHAEDDPFIPARSFRETNFPDSVALELVPRGGHLGYLDRRKFGGDRRWLDARITDWLVRRWKRIGDA